MEKLKKVILTGIYLVLAGVMYYSLQFEKNSIAMGGFNFMYFYLIGIAIIILGVGVFLVHPQVPRVWLLGKYSLELSLPYFISIFMSLIIWVVNFSAPNVMIRGIFYSGYQMLAVLVAASTLYIFGSKGILLNFVAIFLVNIYAMLKAMLEGGIIEFFRQFVALLSSGAVETGDLMVRMEMLGLTYACGMYILFILFARKMKTKADKFILGFAVLFFLLEFKRSGVLALTSALIVGLLLQKMSEEGKKKSLMIIGWILIIIGMVYIWMVKTGTLDMLTEMFQVETSGRNVVFENLDPYYTFDPFYLGTGLGYVTKMMQTGDLYLGINVSDLHNDFLRQYVEQGFWGYLVWLISMFVWRIRFFSKRDTKMGVLTFMIAVFCFGTYFSENTYYQYYSNVNMAMLMMGYAFEKQVEEEKRMSTWL